MSIPEFLSLLDYEQLKNTVKLAKEKIEKIESEDKVKMWVFSSGWVNEGFYLTEKEAVQALKGYVMSEEYSSTDNLKVFSTMEYPHEIKEYLSLNKRSKK